MLGRLLYRPADPGCRLVHLHREHHDAGLPDKPEFEHWALPDVPSKLEPRLGLMRDMAARGVRFIQAGRLVVSGGRPLV